MSAPSAKYLRQAIIRSLRRQGYSVKQGLIQTPKNASKEAYRALNELAVKKKMKKSGPGIQRYENSLLRYIANGWEVIPKNICPKIVLVQPRSEHELLFRYACLHWSIPVSAGYGRRLRFLVFDESNDKLIGLFGLGDPVYAMQARDKWIGWDRKSKAKRLYHVMDAYVLGAVPPYSFLLGGKLIAMLACSNEVRNAFRKKYEGHKSLIKKKKRPPYLAMITTTSALGRSSIYNRIRVNGQEYWTSVGFTLGSGDFHFSNGVYDKIRAYVERHCEPTAKQNAWGDGFRNRREVVRKCLSKIGLSSSLIYHGIRREIFAAPLGRDALRFLQGEVSRPSFYDWSVAEISKKFIERWLLSRAERMPEYASFSKETYRLWTQREDSEC
ncbi:MAG: Druantia anti-phage system protein DruA [Sedimentisphaerales bacterium]|jgi:predicted DNA-binding transcriptional regulator AlpA